MTPVALSRKGIPGLALHALDLQSMHIDEALRAMIDQPAKGSATTAAASSQPNAQSDLSVNAMNKGSNASTFTGAPPPPPVPSQDVSMEASADKRSRELPDTTTKPDGKSLKTSEAASPSPARHVISESCDIDTHIPDASVGQEATSRPSPNRRMANDASKAGFLTRQMHKRVPAWKLRMCIEALNARPR